MAEHFIGLDCGGTNTRGVLAAGVRPVAAATGGPGNPLSAGLRTASSSCRAVIRSLLRDAGIPARDVSAVGLGAAGAGRESERSRMESILRAILPDARIVVDSDAAIALLGATGGGPGIIVISGTGSIAFGIDAQGKRARAGGWGYLVGDEGSGADMGREAVRAVLRAGDGRSPATALRAAVLAHFDVRGTDELISKVYGDPPGSRDWAGLWPHVLEAAESGDAAARAILRRGARDLAETVEAVAKRLSFRGRIPLVLAGGVLEQSLRLRSLLLRRLRRSLPAAGVVEAAAPPEFGALHLARSRVPSHRRTSPR